MQEKEGDRNHNGEMEFSMALEPELIRFETEDQGVPPNRINAAVTEGDPPEKQQQGLSDSVNSILQNLPSLINVESMNPNSIRQQHGSDNHKRVLIDQHWKMSSGRQTESFGDMLSVNSGPRSLQIAGGESMNSQIPNSNSSNFEDTAENGGGEGKEESTDHTVEIVEGMLENRKIRQDLEKIGLDVIEEISSTRNIDAIESDTIGENDYLKIEEEDKAIQSDSSDEEDDFQKNRLFGFFTSAPIAIATRFFAKQRGFTSSIKSLNFLKKKGEVAEKPLSQVPQFETETEELIIGGDQQRKSAVQDDKQSSRRTSATSDHIKTVQQQQSSSMTVLPGNIELNQLLKEQTQLQLGSEQSLVDKKDQEDQEIKIQVTQNPPEQHNHDRNTENEFPIQNQNNPRSIESHDIHNQFVQEGNDSNQATIDVQVDISANRKEEDQEENGSNFVRKNTKEFVVLQGQRLSNNNNNPTIQLVLDPNQIIKTESNLASTESPSKQRQRKGTHTEQPSLPKQKQQQQQPLIYRKRSRSLFQEEETMQGSMGPINPSVLIPLNEFDKLSSIKKKITNYNPADLFFNQLNQINKSQGIVYKQKPQSHNPSTMSPSDDRLASKRLEPISTNPLNSISQMNEQLSFGQQRSRNFQRDHLNHHTASSSVAVSSKSKLPQIKKKPIQPFQKKAFVNQVYSEVSSLARKLFSTNETSPSLPELQSNQSNIPVPSQKNLTQQPNYKVSQLFDKNQLNPILSQIQQHLLPSVSNLSNYQSSKPQQPNEVGFSLSTLSIQQQKRLDNKDIPGNQNRNLQQFGNQMESVNLKDSMSSQQILNHRGWKLSHNDVSQSSLMAPKSHLASIDQSHYQSISQKRNQSLSLSSIVSSIALNGKITNQVQQKKQQSQAAVVIDTANIAKGIIQKQQQQSPTPAMQKPGFISPSQHQISMSHKSKHSRQNLKLSAPQEQVSGADSRSQVWVDPFQVRKVQLFDRLHIHH